MKHAIAISTLALIALGACSKKPEIAASAPARAAPASGPAASPAGPPSRKAGLWTQSIVSDKMQQTIKMCLDAAADAKMKWWGSSQAGRSASCTEEKVTPRLGGGWDFHSVCRTGATGTVTSDGSAMGDFGSHYKVEVNTVTAGSTMQQANGPRTVSIEATWEGPCPADMKPGDIELPGGMRLNAMGEMSGGPSGRVTSSDIAKMRAQALAMARAAHDQEK